MLAAAPAGCVQKTIYAWRITCRVYRQMKEYRPFMVSCTVGQEQFPGCYLRRKSVRCFIHAACRAREIAICTQGSSFPAVSGGIGSAFSWCPMLLRDRKSTRLNSNHADTSYAVLW